MSTINKFSTVDEVTAAIHQERFPLEHRQLQSIIEADRICSGWNLQGCVNGGDEPEPSDDICAACIREEERFYQREMQERDSRDDEAAGSQYAHIHAERVEALRAVVKGQAVLLKAIDAGKKVA